MRNAIIGPENWTVWRSRFAPFARWHRVRASQTGDAGRGAIYAECGARLYARGFRRRAGGVCDVCYHTWTRHLPWNPIDHVTPP